MVLACGAECQPMTITREIETFPSSCRPAKVATDVGDGIIKGLGNPQGPSVLISELIAAELGTWFGLNIPPFAIVRNCPIKIQMLQHHGSIEPPLFFSRFIDGAPRDGTDKFLKRLKEPKDIARLVVFDTWIRNSDRFLDGSDNSDNLLYSLCRATKKYELIPIDHSHCFTENALEYDLLSIDDLIADDKVYGIFPEFGSFITEEGVDAALSDLERLDRKFVSECVNAIPAEWGLSAKLKTPLADLICERAAYVVETAKVALIVDPEFPFDRLGP